MRAVVSGGLAGEETGSVDRPSIGHLSSAGAPEKRDDAAVAVRSLHRRDRAEAGQFVALAAFPPWHPPTPEEMNSPHAKRWLDDWPPDLGLGWEENGVLVGAAWARVVEPCLLIWHGMPLPEVIIAVAATHRGKGIGRRLLEGLQQRGSSAEVPGLVLSVSRLNEAAMRLYAACDFEDRNNTEAGPAIMVWLAGGRRRGSEISDAR